MSLDSCKTYPRTAPHLLSTTRALELCLHPSAFPPRMSRHKSLSGKHWLFWHEPGRKRGVISFVFPQEKKSAKINIFVSMVQPQEKYEHIGEEIKMMDLLADVSSMLVCACVFERRRVLAATVSALFSFVCMSFLNCTSRIVLSVCNCAPLFAMSLLYVCVCKKRQKDCLLKRATKAAGTVRLQGTTWDCRQRDW